MPVTPRRRTVSIVVPSYMGAAKLPALFAALERQNLQREWEIVLVLDGTPDNSLEIAQRYVERLPLVIRNLPKNRGRVHALNAGFDMATGDVLLRCDDDLIPPSCFVEGHARHHDKGGPIGVIGLCRNVFPPTVYSRAYGMQADERHWLEALARPSHQRWLHWAGNCSVSRETYSLVGPYDERFVGYGWEDVDWGYRLHKLGVPLVFDLELSAEHRHAATNCAARIERAYWSGQARGTFEAIHGCSDTPPVKGMWGHATDLLGFPSLAWHKSVGRVLDAAVGRLPRALGRRLIGFSVEAAAAGGYSRPRQRTAEPSHKDVLDGEPEQP